MYSACFSEHFREIFVELPRGYATQICCISKLDFPVGLQSKTKRKKEASTKQNLFSHFIVLNDYVGVRGSDGDTSYTLLWITKRVFPTQLSSHHLLMLVHVCLTVSSKSSPNYGVAQCLKQTKIITLLCNNSKRDLEPLAYECTPRAHKL